MGSIRRRFDFELGGNGYMLVRDQTKGRAWHRTGMPDSNFYKKYNQYSSLPNEVDFAMVWDDWSGGFGHAYRTPENPNTYHWGQSIDARFPGQVMLSQERINITGAEYLSVNLNAYRFTDMPLAGVAAASTPKGAGSVWVHGKGYLAAYSPTGMRVVGSAFNVVKVTNPWISPVGRPALFGSYLYLGIGSASPFLRIDYNGATFTQAQDPLKSEGFVVAGGKLWRYFDGRYLQSCAAVDTLNTANTLLTANWSATLNVSAPPHVIRDITQLEDQLYVGCSDGLYAGDSSGSFQNVLPGPAANFDYDNGRDIDVYDGAILAPFADDLVYFKPGITTAEAGHIGPIGYSSNRSQLQTKVRCVRGYGSWIYAGVWTGSGSEVMAGRMSEKGMIWHPLHTILGVMVNRIHFDGITTPSAGTPEITPRMWISTEHSHNLAAATPALYYVTIPRLYGNAIAADPAFSAYFRQVGNFRTGFDDLGLPGVTKIFRSLEIVGENLSSINTTVGVYYSLDGSTSISELTVDVITPNKQISYFPAVSGSFVTGQNIAVELILQTAVTTFDVSPIIRGIIVRGVARPRSIDQIVAKVRISDNLRDRFAAPMPKSAAQMISDLRTLAGDDGAGIQPQRLTDLTGAQAWVNIIPPIEEEEIYQVGEEHPEIMATIRMSVMEFTTNPWST